MVTDMISDFGISAFTHETTHVNDRMVYLGGSRHREGTDLERHLHKVCYNHLLKQVQTVTLKHWD